MLTMRVRLNPHNDLSQLAHYHVGIITAKLASGDEDALALDCMSAVVAMAFATESVLNYVGHHKLRENWKERSPFSAKIRLLEEKLRFKYDKAAEPYQTIELLKKARDEMAHGKPMEFIVQVPSTRELGRAMAPTWRAATEPELVVAAFERVMEFRALLFTKARIKPGAALTSAAGGGSAA